MRWSVTDTGLAVVTVGRQLPEAAQGLAAAGVSVLATLDWDGLDGLDAGERPLVIAAAPGDIGHGPLEQLAAILENEGLEAIVAFEAEALDAVAAVLMGPRVALLCDADAGEWASALALAGLRAGGARVTGVREDDGERLRRLHEEVARIAGELAALAAEPLASAADSIGDLRTPYAAGAGDDTPVDPGVVRAAIRARRLRGQFFPARLLEDPGWDILLDLFAAELEGGQVSVSSLCIASGVAPTTALRWISRMAGAGLMVRMPDAVDKRRAFLALSAVASEGMRGYVAAVRRAGLPVV